MKKIFKHFFSPLIFLTAIIFLLPFISLAQVDLSQTQGVAASAGLGTVEGKIVIGQIIKIALGFLGLIGLVIVLIAGFKWMTSGGNEEKIKSAKKMLMAGLVGMLIILFSYLIVNFIINKVQEGVNPGPVPPGPDPISCSIEGCVGCNSICRNGFIESNSDCNYLCSDQQNISILSNTPRGNSVKLCQAVQIRFSDVINEATVDGNVNIYKCNNANCSDKTNINDDGEFTTLQNIVKFSLDSYEANTTYRVELVSTGIESVDGKKLKTDFSWQFTTGTEGDSVPPTVTGVFPSGNDVCLKSHISAEFSEEMDQISLLSLDNFKLFKDANIQEALAFQLADFAFQHSASDNKLILTLKPNINFDANTKYLPLLDGSKIMDSCGNKLDGNGDKVRVDNPVDNYPSNGPSDRWSFTSGLNDKCEPTITRVSPDKVYYDGGNITITGKYLRDAVVVFDNQIIVDESTALCISEAKDKWPNKICKSGDWNSDSISLFIPAAAAKEGDLNGIKTGSIKVQTPQGFAITKIGLLSPRIESVSPEEGGGGQFVTISGSGFGDSKGIGDRVVLRLASNNDPSGDIELSCGDGSWNDEFIIVSIPENLDLGEYYFQVVKKGILQEEKWSNTYKFEVDNSTPGPGLCSVSPNTRKYNENFIATGVRLGDSSYDVDGNKRNVLIGSLYNAVTSTVISWSNPDNGQDTKVTVQTPNLRKGKVGVRVMTKKDNVTKFSNSIPLNIDEDATNQFKITYISPASSTVGSYITIYGSGFGNEKGSSKVVFKNGGSDNWFDGNFQFPSVCSTDYWKNDRVIVKVPDNFIGITGRVDSQIKIIKGQQETNAVSFAVISGNPAPSICSINPANGVRGDRINVYGEYFENPDIDKATFSYGQDDDTATIFGHTENTAVVVVPSTKTGLLALHSNATGYGNTVNFEYRGSSITPPTENWDFYGWHFATCANCKTPRVKVSACANGVSSPSPSSGSTVVPRNAQIYFEFEYSDGSPVRLNTNTLVASNFQLLDCGNATNPVCSTNIKSFSREDFNESSIQFSSNFASGYWYQFSIKPDSIYDVDNSLLSENHNTIIFRIDSDGRVCQVDTMKVNPRSYVADYESSKKIPYYTNLWDSNGCYACNGSAYDYTWAKNPDTSDLLSNFISLGNKATATLNNAFRTGTITIESRVVSTTLNLNLFASSTLQVRLGCSVYNSDTDITSRQTKCIDESGTTHPGLTCCWNSSLNMCINDGSPVCSQPYLKLKSCQRDRDGVVISLGSPSPITNITNAPTDAIIHAQFSGRGDDFSMNKNTYAGGVEVYYCGKISTSNCTLANIGTTVSNDSGNDFVNYGHTSNFVPNAWYKIKLNDSIKDNNGNSLQPAQWYFKTASSTCHVTQVNVVPNPVQLPVLSSKRITALCSDDSCNICDSSDYQYSWGSRTPSIANVLNSNANISTTTGVSVGMTTVKVEVSKGNIQTTGNETNSVSVNKDSFRISNSVNVIVQANCSRFKDLETCTNGGCCFSNNRCISNLSTCNFGNFTMKSYYPRIETCLNPMIRAEFDAVVNGVSLNIDNVILEDLNKETKCKDDPQSICYEKVPIQFYSYSKSTSTSIINIQIIQALQRENKYRVRLLKSIRSIDGKNLTCDGPECSWEFKTINSPCELSYVNIIDPANHFYEYTQPNVEKNFIAEAIDSFGNPMVRVDGFYSWDWQWSSQDNTLVNIVGLNTNFSSTFKSNNKNGNTTVTIKAKKKTPAIGYTGEDIKDEANISLFMCNSPWIFEDYGFRLRYCMDGGLPELNDRKDAVITITNARTSGNGLIREYIFKYKEAKPVVYSNLDSKSKKGVLSIATDNRLGVKMFTQVFGSIFNNFVSRVLAQNLSYQDDLIGIRVYANDDHLSPRDWYRKTNEFDFKGSPQAKKVGFYDGLIDGRTTYINAGKKSISVDGAIDIHTEIYLISKNQDASPFTNNIYGQLLDGWKFNAQETLIDQEKIAQDVKRWQDLRTMENSLESYANSNKFCAKKLGTCSHCAEGSLNCDTSIITIGGECFSMSNVSCNSDSDCILNPLNLHKCFRTYPELTSGTYIRGLTNSLWGSWDSNLGAALKTTLPKDPENKFGNCQVDCPTCDETTCFDDKNKIFNCPTGSKVYYYKVGTYQSSAIKSLNYSIYSLFNYSDKSMWSGNNDAKFSNNKIEISNDGVCDGESETNMYQ